VWPVIEALNSRPAFVVTVAVVSAVVIAFAFIGVSYLVLWLFLAFVFVAVFAVAFLNARRSIQRSPDRKSAGDS
jgi:hypothetical protein